MSLLTLQEIQQRLDEWLDVEFSYLKTAPLVEAIANMPADQQRFILEWIHRVSSIHVHLAYRFAWNVFGHLGRLDHATLEAWALHAMDSYDTDGLHAAMDVIEDVERFIAKSRDRMVGATFEESARVLLPFLHGLSGRRMMLDESDDGGDPSGLHQPPIFGTPGFCPR